jgi:alcohol dehydrogenase class IV
MHPASLIPSPLASPFTVARVPSIRFGRGRIRELPQLVAEHGRNLLLVTGGSSFRGSRHWPVLTEGLKEQDIAWELCTVAGEPSPDMIDEAVRMHGAGDIDVVVGIGGGSALDAAKAIAGLLPSGNSVMDHLEGVGKGLPYRGPAIPFIAVPTTAGTGSEATKNAVLSRVGSDGFKKSFRDEALIPLVALVDADLLVSCSRQQIIANGMDAFAQLLESYVSARASAFTDALAWSGMEAFHRGFFRICATTPVTAEDPGFDDMAYAALLSGITLAQAGLGSIHGLAAPLGAQLPIPHGVACGTLLAEAVAINIEALSSREPNHRALEKYRRVAGLLYARANATHADLVALLRDWVTRLELPRLSHYGADDGQLAAVVGRCRSGSMLTNPLRLHDEELEELLRRRL